MTVDRFRWQLALRGDGELTATVRLVGLTASTHADRHGRRVFPGVALLARECALGERATRAALATLRDRGWLVRESSGSALGRRAVADVYRLALPAGTAAPHTGDPNGTAAPRAGDRSRTAAPHAGDQVPEHRHFTTGTPAFHDRNTGTRCRPNSHEEVQEGETRATPPPTPNPRHCDKHAYDDFVEVSCVACMRARERHERQQAEADRPPPRPPWCGECDERTRLRETPDGLAQRCRQCHPNARDQS
ncbi:helix-turn-helix domain-containing protein [Geodermatophilus ruber]|uniref:helix-turn-helix domain-containing protein n=1 Tax=Geodermatophilus ruber TaxID=504800 RepID=UPI001160918C|nr:helix-turn-helix domain-containing protein [Geodermatophilus ruber]